MSAPLTGPVTLLGRKLDIEDVAGLLKEYFYDLPDPLCTYAEFDNIVNTQSTLASLVYNLALALVLALVLVLVLALVLVLVLVLVLMITVVMMLGAEKYSDAESHLMINDLHEIVNRLPISHRETLKYFILFLRRVMRHSEVNKMNSSNLALCVGPNLLRPLEYTIEYSLNIPKANSALNAMIDHAVEIFELQEGDE